MEDTNHPVQQEQEIEVIEGIAPELQKLPVKKICIVGTCPSRMMAPIDDPSWDIWTIGPGGKNMHRWDRLFEIHGTDSWPEGFRDYLTELEAEKPPKIIYTEDAMDNWPANVVYPKSQMFDKFGRMWFSSSIAYALAMAIEENATELGIFGIDLESGEEYQSQFVGAKYFIHLARLAGITISMPKGCGLGRDPNPYPDAWETHLAMTIDAKNEYLGQMAAEKRQLHGNLAAEINHLDGEIAAFNYIKNLYVINGEDPGQRAPNQAGKMSSEAKMELVLDYLMANGAGPKK